ncbi:GNAT family N-acetyltransferase [Herbiconiux sp. A18JL235]|uniref:GNAT family N-acetyltransferase n=1 Tax=Herbiconiux sp. A18JL235 TaxID=3152363 RepID=A0AB39BJU0_9MICO
MPAALAATAADFAAAAHLLVDFNREYDDPAPEPAWLADRLAALSAAGDTSVLLTGEPPLGVAVLRFRENLWQPVLEAYLAELYVAPQHRGRGLGTALLDEVIAHARSRGAGYLDLNTSEDDLAARHLYDKRGFDCHEGRGSGPLAVYYELDLG